MCESKRCIFPPQKYKMPCCGSGIKKKWDHAFVSHASSDVCSRATDVTSHNPEKLHQSHLITHIHDAELFFFYPLSDSHQTASSQSRKMGLSAAAFHALTGVCACLCVCTCMPTITMRFINAFVRCISFDSLSPRWRESYLLYLSLSSIAPASC